MLFGHCGLLYISLKLNPIFECTNFSF